MERESLASSVGLSPQQVRVWFQNRRQKVKQFLSQRQVRNGQSSTATQNGDKEGKSLLCVFNGYGHNAAGRNT